MQQQQHAAPATGGMQQPQSVHEHREQELPGLAGIGSVIHWIEELVMLLSGPLLTIGLGIALIDLLTGGDLLRTWPFLLFTWGVCQAVGIDSQLVAMWDRARRAIRERHYWSLVGYIVLGCLLGYVGFISAEAFGFQHAFAVSEAQALSRLGIDPISWQLQRAVLAVFLVALSGFTRYHPPAKNHSAKAADEAERLQAEIALAPLRAQLNAAKLRGVRSAVAAGFGRDDTPRPAPARAYGAAYEAPAPSIARHHEHDALAAHNMMHDWDIPDEVEDDDDPYHTRVMAALSDPLANYSGSSKTQSQDGAVSDAEANSLDQLLDDYDDTDEGSDDDYYAIVSTHKQKQRKNKKMRAKEAAIRVAKELSRRNAITRAVEIVLNAACDLRESPTEMVLLQRVNDVLKEADEYPISQPTLHRYKKGWQNKYHRKVMLQSAQEARDVLDSMSTPVEPMEPAEIRELAEAWD